ncbi:hypothetical protein TgHK011_008310 [Trichoderma gracile]|nr:hypothetical protein TgHK011_008310 [Trichoderma gracile]
MSTPDKEVASRQTDPDQQAATGPRPFRGVRDSPAKAQLAPIKKVRNPSTGQLGHGRSQWRCGVLSSEIGAPTGGSEGEGQNLFPRTASF